MCPICQSVIGEGEKGAGVASQAPDYGPQRLRAARTMATAMAASAAERAVLVGRGRWAGGGGRPADWRRGWDAFDAALSAGGGVSLVAAR